MMETIYDVQQLLKKFGTVIYVGDRLADLQLMEEELKELQHSSLIDPKEYQMALLLLRHEIQKELDKRKNGGKNESVFYFQHRCGRNHMQIGNRDHRWPFSGKMGHSTNAKIKGNILLMKFIVLFYKSYRN